MTSDPLFKMLVEIGIKMSDSTEGRTKLGITLHVAGMLVSGYVINQRQFLLTHPLTDKLLEVGEKLEESDEESVAVDDESPHFIHLSDARFFLPGHPPIPNDGGVYWRGRISEVSGFSFGILDVTEDNPPVPTGG
jgi:hypothetical protein